MVGMKEKELGQKPNINYEGGHKHEPDFTNRKGERFEEPLMLTIKF